MNDIGFITIMLGKNNPNNLITSFTNRSKGFLQLGGLMIGAFRRACFEVVKPKKQLSSKLK
jgi:hypothetical protein